MSADLPSPDQPPEGQDATPESERESRDSMLLLANVHRANGENVIVKVRNLSAGGLMAECPVHMLKDEAIEVQLRGIGLVPARVVWTTGSRIGLAFDHIVDHRKARQRVTGGTQPLLLRASRDFRRPSLR